MRFWIPTLPLPPKQLCFLSVLHTGVLPKIPFETRALNEKVWKLLSQSISLLRAFPALIYNSVITQVRAHEYGCTRIHGIFLG